MKNVTDKPRYYTFDKDTRDYKEAKPDHGRTFWGWQLVNDSPKVTRRLALATTWIEPGDFLAKSGALLYVLPSADQHGVKALDLDRNSITTVGADETLARAGVRRYATGSFMAIGDKSGTAYVLSLRHARVVCYPCDLETARRIAGAMDRWHYHPLEKMGEYLYEQQHKIGSYTVRRDSETSYVLFEGKRELCECETVHDALKCAIALRDIHKPNRVVADKWTNDPIMKVESL